MTDYTAEQLRQMLAEGEAVARLIKSEEAWYASAIRLRPGVKHEWSMGIDPATGGGTYGEFVIEWIDLGCGPLHPRLKVFGDGTQALLTIPEVITAIELRGMDAVYDRLLQIGYVDKTERTNPRGEAMDTQITITSPTPFPAELSDALGTIISQGRQYGVAVSVNTPWPPPQEA